MRFFLDTLLTTFVVLAALISFRYLWKRYKGGNKPYTFATISSTEKLAEGSYRVNFIVRKTDVISLFLKTKTGEQKDLLSSRNFEEGKYHLDINAVDYSNATSLVFKSIDSFAERKL